MRIESKSASMHPKMSRSFVMMSNASAPASVVLVVVAAHVKDNVVVIVVLIAAGGVAIMAEKLLSRKEAANRLGISPRSFSRHRAKLMALGLQAVQIGQYPKFREASLDRLIERLADQGGGR